MLSTLLRIKKFGRSEISLIEVCQQKRTMIYVKKFFNGDENFFIVNNFILCLMDLGLNLHKNQIISYQIGINLRSAEACSQKQFFRFFFFLRHSNHHPRALWCEV